MGEVRIVYKILVEKTEGKRPLESPWRRWTYKIKLYVTEIRKEGVDWISLAQNMEQSRTFVNTVMYFRFHKGKEFLFWLSDC
jgi:hypothetical protein